VLENAFAFLFLSGNSGRCITPTMIDLPCLKCAHIKSDRLNDTWNNRLFVKYYLQKRIAVSQRARRPALTVKTKILLTGVLYGTLVRTETIEIFKTSTMKGHV